MKYIHLISRLIEDDDDEQLAVQRKKQNNVEHV